MGLGWPAEDCGVLSFQEHFQCDTCGNKRFRDQPSLARTVPCKSLSLLPVCPSTLGSERPQSKKCEHQLLCLLTLKSLSGTRALCGQGGAAEARYPCFPDISAQGPPSFGFGFCFLLFEFLETKKKKKKIENTPPTLPPKTTN